MKELTYTYRDVKATYNFAGNLADKWVAELRRRERAFDTLTEFREAVDRPAPKEKKPFTRIKCLCGSRYGNGPFRSGEVTSVAEKGRFDRTDSVWVTFSDGKREKVEARYCYPATAPNVEITQQIWRVTKEIEQLEEAESELRDKLTPVTIPNE